VTHPRPTAALLPRVRAAAACALALTAVCAAPSHAAIDLFSSAYIGFGQDDIPAFFQEGSVSDANGLPVSFTDSFSYGGEFGDPMVIAGTATASAQFGQLRASGTGTLTNPIPRNGGEPYIVEEEEGVFVTNPGGLPDDFAVTGQARFGETLQYGGTAVSYTSRYILRVTGNIEGDETGSFASVSIKHANDPTEFFSFSGNGTYNEFVTSEAYVHGGAPQQITITLQSSFAARADSVPGDVEGSVDFGNTLELVGIDLRDADTGAFLSDAIITSESGAIVPVMRVPEPTTALLLGGVALTAVRRRRG